MNAAEVPSQQERENPEPVEGSRPTPWLVVALTAVLLAFGTTYIARSRNAVPPDWGDGRTAAELRGIASASGAATAVDGSAVFASHCQACHQASGAGLPGVFPPLAGSEWVAGKASTLATIVLRGASGRLTVNGTPYNGVMPTFARQLRDEEIAAVLTHIRTSWGNTGAPVKPDVVAAARKENASLTTPLDGDADLRAMK